MLLAAALAVLLTAAQDDGASPSPGFDMFAGAYALEDGRVLTVEARPGGLVATLDAGSLLDYADTRGDSRVLDVEARTTALMTATLAGQRDRVAALLGDADPASPDYVAGHFEVMAPMIDAYERHGRFEIAATVYRDEDSDNGFEDQGWGWEVFIRFEAGDEDAFARLVWDGNDGRNTHRGSGRAPPRLSALSFDPRAPSRSWIRVYDPHTQTTRRLREMPREHRMDAIPARFVAYDIAVHDTVSMRFRRPDPSAAMRVEIGPLGSDALTVGQRLN